MKVEMFGTQKKCYATFIQQLWFFADLQGRYKVERKLFDNKG